MRSRLSARLLTTTLVTVLGGGLGGVLVVPAASAADASPGAGRDSSALIVTDSASRAARATATLSQATSLFAHRSASSARRTLVGSGRDATLVLRDLAHQAGDLPTADQRAAARRILARPTDGGTPGEPKYDPTQPIGVACDATLCVHWEEADTLTPANAVPDDGNVATVPAYVQTVLGTLAYVYSTETGTLGYRPPLSDGVAGGDGRTDVYLAELGNQGLYGYCAPEGGAAQATGYCVLDNDYSPAEYGTNDTPLENLQVTAAHEFFHAIQFGYNSFQDTWFMEGTAVWMEDQVYTDVNDNLQYLQRQSPIRDPYIPMDYTGRVTSGTTVADYSPYGSWVFWKFLSEHAGAGATSDPSIIRQVWEEAQGTYSTSALQKVLTTRHTNFSREWKTFGTWISNPKAYFAEGATYPAIFYDGKATLSPRKPAAKARLKVSHMTHDFVRLRPSSRLSSRYRLRLSVDMAGTSRGSAARYVVHYRSGRLGVATVKLDKSGRGSRTLPFSHRKVSYVQVDLAGTSTRYVGCGGTAPFSCGGRSPDDNLTAKLTARAYRS